MEDVEPVVVALVVEPEEDNWPTSLVDIRQDAMSLDHRLSKLAYHKSWAHLLERAAGALVLLA